MMLQPDVLRIQKVCAKWCRSITLPSELYRQANTDLHIRHHVEIIINDRQQKFIDETELLQITYSNLDQITNKIIFLFD